MTVMSLEMKKQVSYSGSKHSKSLTLIAIVSRDTPERREFLGWAGLLSAERNDDSGLSVCLASP